jgi:membrane-bound lytic murein transglycosylase MltF
VGRSHRIDPALILAVMAIESNFNPFAQSAVGAQGLMQVMTGVHSDKYEPFGGLYAAFDPKTNLRVGVKVLQECIARAGGSVAQGLKCYVGAANVPGDSIYATKVLAERARLSQAAQMAQMAARPAPRKPVPTEASAPVKVAALP